MQEIIRHILQLISLLISMPSQLYIFNDYILRHYLQMRVLRNSSLRVFYRDFHDLTAFPTMQRKLRNKVYNYRFFVISEYFEIIGSYQYVKYVALMML